MSNLMSNREIEISFLGKKYTFPTEIDEYYSCLNLIIRMQSCMYSEFCRLASDAENGIIPVASIVNLFENNAKKFIKRLVDCGICSISARDFIESNEGYIRCLNLTTDYCNAFIEIEDDLKHEQESRNYDARLKADASITGSGVSVISSSFIDLAIGEFVDGMARNSQAHKADMQYILEVSQISTAIQGERHKRIADYQESNYFPAIRQGIELFTCLMLSDYFRVLRENNLCNINITERIDTQRSESFLKNLEFSHDKAMLLGAAFNASPLNPQVYIECANVGLLGSEEVEAAKRFKQYASLHNHFASKLFSSMHTLNWKKDSTSIEPIIRILSLCDGKSIVSHRQSFFKEQYDKVVNAYAELVKSTELPSVIIDKVEELKDSILNVDKEQISENLSTAHVSAIVSRDNFVFLMELYGLDVFLIDVFGSAEDVSMFSTKENIDDFVSQILKKRLYEYIESACLERSAQLEETAKNKKAIQQQYRKIQYITVLVGLAVLIVALIARYFLVINWQNSTAKIISDSVAERYTNGIQRKDSDLYKYGITDYEITDISYYTNGRWIDIVPSITVHSSYSSTDPLWSSYSAKFISSELNCRALAHNALIPPPVAFLRNKDVMSNFSEVRIITTDGKEYVGSYIRDDYKPYSPLLPYMGLGVFLYLFILLTATYVIEKQKRCKIACC